MFAEGEAAEAAGATAAGASGLSNYAMAYSKEHSRKSDSELSRAVILIAKSETTLKFGLKTLRAFPNIPSLSICGFRVKSRCRISLFFVPSLPYISVVNRSRASSLQTTLSLPVTGKTFSAV